jgi:DNA primase
MRGSRDGIDTIKRRNDLGEVVIEHGIELKRRGKTYFGLCPFHEEKTASFGVNREAGLFHCFGCGVGGDVIGFVVRFHQISFREALERLAMRAGIALDELMEPADLAAPREALAQRLHEQAAVRYARLAAQRTDGSRQTVVGSKEERSSTLPSTNYRLPSVVNGRRP